MFLADVITGDYILGSSTLVAPPAKTGGMKNDLYDSMVNKMANPEIFVIFKDASAYPTYLITYKWDQFIDYFYCIKVLYTLLYPLISFRPMKMMLQFM